MPRGSCLLAQLLDELVLNQNFTRKVRRSDGTHVKRRWVLIYPLAPLKGELPCLGLWLNNNGVMRIGQAVQRNTSNFLDREPWSAGLDNLAMFFSLRSFHRTHAESCGKA